MDLPEGFVLTGCVNHWKLPSMVETDTEKLFSNMPEGGAILAVTGVAISRFSGIP